MPFGVDILTPTTVPGDDGWKPVLDEGGESRLLMTDFEVIRFIDCLARTNSSLKTRVVQVTEEGTYARRI